MSHGDPAAYHFEPPTRGNLKVLSSTLVEARADASRCFTAFFGGREWTMVDVSAHAQLAVGGHILFWEVDFVAEQK